MEYAPADSRLAVETVRKPATKAVTPKAAVAKYESTKDSTGAESEEKTVSGENGKFMVIIRINI